MNPKVEEYFEQLVAAVESDDYEKADIYLARLSVYGDCLTPEQEDYYQFAHDLVSYQGGFKEPTEYDEWNSYDEYC